MIDKLEDHPERVRSWTEDQNTVMFFLEVAEMKENWIAKIRRANDLSDAFRAQGALEAIDAILAIPRVALRLMEDKKAGKRS